MTSVRLATSVVALAAAAVVLHAQDRDNSQFRFRSGLWNRVVDPLVPLFDFEKNDPEVQKLDAAAKTNMGPRLSRLAQRGGADGAERPTGAPASPRK